MLLSIRPTLLNLMSVCLWPFFQLHTNFPAHDESPCGTGKPMEKQGILSPHLALLISFFERRRCSASPFALEMSRWVLTLLYAVPESLQICFANCVLAVPLISMHGSKDPPTLLLSAHSKVNRHDGSDYDQKIDVFHRKR